jgi:epoxide hydrolase 4
MIMFSSIRAVILHAWSITLFGIAIFLGHLSLSGDIWDEVSHAFTENNGIPLHYARIGEGPLVIMIHGFPDFWYTWRHQMESLKQHHTLVALDQRGYNRSGQPHPAEAYDMRHLVSDVAAVIKSLGKQKASIVGHDWGGAVAWQFAFAFPEMTRHLIVMNLPHPAGFMRELTLNKQQRANSAYAMAFKRGSVKDPDIFFGRPMTPANLAGWVTEPEARQRYLKAFRRSSLSGMLQFYKQNYPELPDPAMPLSTTTPRIQCPVLVFHGLRDTALHADGLNNTWDWIDNDLTLITIPEAGHFVHRDAKKKVSEGMLWWLKTH